MEPAEGVLFGLALVFVVFWLFQWLAHVIAIVYGSFRLHRKSVISPEDCSFPGVTILKPLVGVDSNLVTNLETFFTLTYPKYEILFCVEDASDPSVMVVKSLISKHPNIDAQLFVGGAKELGINPKINNLAQAYDFAKYELLLISDSGIKMSQDTLLDMVACCTSSEKVGLVHQLPFVCDRKGFAAVLEKVYFGTQHARMYLLAAVLGINCVTGMSCLFRKTVLDETGGIQVLGSYLAEDFYLGHLFLSRGWTVKICSQPALQNSGAYSVRYFQARMIRWRRLRVSLAPLTIVMEPLSECLLLGLVTSWSVGRLFDWSSTAFFFVHLLIWSLLDYALLLVIQGGHLPFSKFDYVIGWLFRELTSLSLTVKAHASRTITWRNKTYAIGRGATGEEIKPVQTQRVNAY